MIGHRATGVGVKFNAHADSVAVWPGLVHVLIDAVRLNDLDADPVTKKRALDDLQEHLSITGQASDDVVFEINHAHAAINSGATHARKLSPSRLNHIAASHIHAAINVAGLQLQAKPIFPNDVGAQKLQVTAEILIVALKIARTVADVTDCPTNLAVGAAVASSKVSKEPPFCGGCIIALGNLRRFVALEHIKQTHQENLTLTVAPVGFPRFARSSVTVLANSALYLSRASINSAKVIFVNERPAML